MKVYKNPANNDPCYKFTIRLNLPGDNYINFHKYVDHNSQWYSQEFLFCGDGHQTTIQVFESFSNPLVFVQNLFTQVSSILDSEHFTFSEEEK